MQVRFDSHDNLVIAGVVRGSVDFGGGLLDSADDLDYDIVIAKLAPDGTHIWSKQFGDEQNQLVEGLDLDDAGNIAIAGSFGGSLDFGLGPLSGKVYVAKLNAAGAPIFNHAFSSPSDFQFRAVAADGAGNVAVAGIFSGTVSIGGPSFSFSGVTTFGYGTVVGKFAPDGTYLWSIILNPDGPGPPPVWKVLPGLQSAGGRPPWSSTAPAGFRWRERPPRPRMWAASRCREL